MKKIAAIFSVVAALTLLIGTTNIAFGQGATRTWVSGVGDDANPCSRTAPCKTFAGAISKTAAGGEIDALDPGGFGAVTIVKSITIDGGPNAGGILSAATNGIIINAAAADKIVLKNLNIQGAGTGLNGIRFLAGGSLSLQNVKVLNVTQSGIDFEPGGASQLFATDVTVENSGQHGILIKPGVSGSAKVILDRVQSYNNLNGLRAEDRSNVTIYNSVAAGNANNGFLALSNSQATTMLIESSVASGNANPGSGGVHAFGALATIRISNLTTTNNGNGLLTSGGTIISFGNNKNAGNVTNGAPTSPVGLQ